MPCLLRMREIENRAFHYFVCRTSECEKYVGDVRPIAETVRTKLINLSAGSVETAGRLRRTDLPEDHVNHGLVLRG